jgi:NodT family efflux transporter outer membrane factor (OMF) lipoprotein
MIASDRETVALVAKANALGGSTATARVAAQSQVEEDEALLPPLKAQLSSARHALALLSGKGPADGPATDFQLADLRLTSAVPVALPSDLVRRRPDILAAEAELHAATADIGVATADLYPKLQLTAALAQGALRPGDLFSYDTTGWSVGAGLTAPLFDGGALRARRQQAREAALAASARYRQTVITAFSQVADALSALAADDDLVAAYTRAGVTAAESLRLAREAYRMGGGTLFEVLDAQRTAHKFQASLVRAQGQRLADVVRLFAASGADWRPAA